MIYEELHQRYGSHIAKRVQVELSYSEFSRIDVAELTAYLDLRAEAAHKEYKTRLDNPFINEELGAARGEYVEVLHRRWRDAEDLAYLVTVADDVSGNTRRMMAGGKA